jgi:hypothetical protein
VFALDDVASVREYSRSIAKFFALEIVARAHRERPSPRRATRTRTFVQVDCLFRGNRWTNSGNGSFRKAAGVIPFCKVRSMRAVAI